MHSESPVSRPAGLFLHPEDAARLVHAMSRLCICISRCMRRYGRSPCVPTIDVRRATPAAIDRKLARYGIRGLEVYSGATHAAMQTSFPYITRLARESRRRSSPMRILISRMIFYPEASVDSYRKRAIASYGFCRMFRSWPPFTAPRRFFFPRAACGSPTAN